MTAPEPPAFEAKVALAAIKGDRTYFFVADNRQKVGIELTEVPSRMWLEFARCDLRQVEAT